MCLFILQTWAKVDGYNYRIILSEMRKGLYCPHNFIRNKCVSMSCSTDMKQTSISHVLASDISRSLCKRELRGDC